MEISGPITIGVLDNDSGGRELHLSFRNEFRILKLPQQVESFQNFINSTLKPSDVRSMCCRLQLDKRELENKTGGLFGSGEKTGRNF